MQRAETPDEALRRRRNAARRLTKWLNAHDLPGVEPFRVRDRLLFAMSVVVMVLIMLLASAAMQPH